jgi:FtsZ-binding cell division protein ZapB
VGKLEKNVLENINDLETKLSYLITKLYTFRNENITLHQRIANLENENSILREKRDVTLEKLRTILQKIDEADM